MFKSKVLCVIFRSNKKLNDDFLYFLLVNKTDQLYNKIFQNLLQYHPNLLMIIHVSENLPENPHHQFKFTSTLMQNIFFGPLSSAVLRTYSPRNIM
jgi:uncharacterized protein YcgL (UPF0745 family)